MDTKHMKRKLIRILLVNNFIGRFFILFMAKANPEENLFCIYTLLWEFMVYIWWRDTKYSAKKYDLNPELLSYSKKTSKFQTKSFLIAGAMIGLSILIYRLLFGIFKLEYMLNAHMDQFGNFGFMSFFAQIIYFAIEIIAISIVASQAHDLAPKERWFIPYGGVVLAVTWGGSRFFTGSGLAGSIFMDFTWQLSSLFSSYSLRIGFYYITISLLIGILPALFRGDNSRIFPVAVLLYLL
jgi:hypothetical protein